jgi:hypothetical protein
MAALAFGSCVGGGVLGIAAAAKLPKHHLSEDSKDVVRICSTIVATLAALVLGFLVSSAKASFDAKDGEIKRVSVRIILLDRTLADYGEAARPARDALRNVIGHAIDAIWREGSSPHIDPNAALNGRGMTDVKHALQALTPADDNHRALRTSALALSDQIEETRWDALFQQGGGVRWPVVALLAFWFLVIFSSIGLFAPFNGIVVAVLLICSLSVSAAIYMIVQMDQPFSGLIQISNEPLKIALSQIGK